MMVQLVFAVWLGWLPVGGRFPATLIPPEGSGFYLLDSLLQGNGQQFWGAIRHLVLPASTLGITAQRHFCQRLAPESAPGFDSDYVEAARSRGLSETRVVLRHALQCPAAGADDCRHHRGVFDRWGPADRGDLLLAWVAYRLQEAISQRNYPVVQGIVVVVASLVVAVSVLVDLLVALLDPRVKF